MEFLEWVHRLKEQKKVKAKYNPKYVRFRNDLNSIPTERTSRNIVSMEKKSRENRFKEYEKILNESRKSFEKKWENAKARTVKLEDFDMLQTLGTGAYGRVVLAKYKTTGAFYAMKVLSKKKLVKTKQIAHTLSEKRVLLSVDFPFLIHMKWCFMNPSYVYLVLPYVSGGELFSYLRLKGKFDEDTAKFYAAQVALSLEYLHHCNLIYRDLKPENILIDQTGYLKLTDFGFCKMIKNGRTWTLCGTPEYLAPEIILSKGYGKSVDWWSFGILIYEMTSGYVPFYSSNPMRIYEKIVQGKFDFASHFSNDLKDILGHIIQIDLTRRYGNLKNGVLDIKRHPWFSNVNFLQIYHKNARAPFVPKIQHAGDGSNFDSYEEEEMLISEIDEFKKEFEDF